MEATEQCSECKLWFPEYDPKPPTTCALCGHPEIQVTLDGFKCLDCDHLMRPVKCLDGHDEDGNMAHVSGKPALKPICIFCDSPGEDNSHATPGIRRGPSSEQKSSYTVRYTDGSITRHESLAKAQEDIHDTVIGCDFAVGVEAIIDDQNRMYGCTWSVKLEEI